MRNHVVPGSLDGRIWDRRLTDSADIVITKVMGMHMSDNVYAKRRDAVNLIMRQHHQAVGQTVNISST